MRRVDKFGRRWAKDFGAVYVLVAKKRVSTLTPIKPKWTTEPVIVSTPIGSRLEKYHD